MKALAKAALFGVIIFGFAAPIGCTNRKMKQMNVTVAVDPSVGGAYGMLPVMDVDLIGVPPEKLEEYRTMSASQYWQANSQKRQGAKEYTKTLSFSQDNKDPKTITKKDPMWKTWKNQGARWLVVMSNLPGRHADAPGDQDDRREIIPLEAYRWKGNKINILIKPSGADISPPTNPEKKK